METILLDWSFDSLDTISTGGATTFLGWGSSFLMLVELSVVAEDSVFKRVLLGDSFLIVETDFFDWG